MLYWGKQRHRLAVPCSCADVFPSGYGFHPGIALVPETEMLFIGAGDRLSIYRLDGPTKVCQETVGVGFWRWARHGAILLMSAETELAAWSINATWLWSTFVEPPWEYTVTDGMVCLDVMGEKSTFPLDSGPLLR